MRSDLPPATWPRADATDARLLRVDPRTGATLDGHVRELPSLLRPGDLLVVNDAGTLPASLQGRSGRGPVEVRLAGPPDAEGAVGARWPAVLFGSGTWRERTEDRPAPPELGVGERIAFGDLEAGIVAVSTLSPRLVALAFDRPPEELWPALYRLARPVQYSYLRGPLSLWHVQTPFGGRPLAVEMPSAGHALRLPLVRALRRNRIGLASISHAAGLSSTGDPVLDAALPLPEPSDISTAAAAAIDAAKASGGRVVAVGTTVVRALEGRALEGRSPLRPGPGRTRLRIGPDHQPRVVDGILTGVHSPGESHFELLRAFAPRLVLEDALRLARDLGYLAHEFGDLSLILAA